MIPAWENRGFVDTTTTGGWKHTIDIDPAAIEDAFEAHGLSDYLRRKEPGAADIRAEMQRLCETTRTRRIVWESSGAPG